MGFLKEAEADKTAAEMGLLKEAEGDNAAAFIDNCKFRAASLVISMAAANTEATFSNLQNALPLKKFAACLCAFSTDTAAL